MNTSTAAQRRFTRSSCSVAAIGLAVGMTLLTGSAATAAEPDDSDTTTAVCTAVGAAGFTAPHVDGSRPRYLPLPE